MLWRFFEQHRRQKHCQTCRELLNASSDHRRGTCCNPFLQERPGHPAGRTDLQDDETQYCSAVKSFTARCWKNEKYHSGNTDGETGQSRR